jgi:hypothetical protein
MYYKIEKGTKTFTDHQRIWDKIKRCNKEAYEIVEQLGFKEYCRDNSSCGGGISAFYNGKEKPENFKVVGKDYQCLYYPKVSQKATIKLIDNLPLVSFEEFNHSIGFEEQFAGMSHYRSLGSKRVGDVYIISVYDECDYTPKSDMVEILASEYKELNK